MMKALHWIRSGGTQRHDGVELGRGSPPAGRNDHNRSLLDHLRGLEACIEVAYQQGAWLWMEGQHRKRGGRVPNSIAGGSVRLLRIPVDSTRCKPSKEEHGRRHPRRASRITTAKQTAPPIWMKVRISPRRTGLGTRQALPPSCAAAQLHP